MGYDMYFKGKRWSDGDEFYFRLNVWGMSRYAGYMLERGMAFDGPGPGEFPKAPDQVYEDYSALKYPEDYPGVTLTPERRAAAEEYGRRLDEHLSWHGPEIPGIPLHKFSTNDGWLVLPAECAAAVRAARKHPAPAEDPDYWAKWIDYLDRASRAEGFEVR